MFIVGVKADGRAGAERAAEVLSVGSRCRRHPPTGIEAGPEPAERVARSVTGSSGKRHDPDTDTYVNALDQRRGGADDNEAQAGQLVARLHPSLRSGGHGSPGIGRDNDEDRLVATLRVGGRAQGAGSSYDNTPYTVVGPVRTTPYADGRDDDHTRLISFKVTGDPRAADQPYALNSSPHGVLSTSPNPHRVREIDGLAGRLDPVGFDSHRYRCCGNGVVSDVSEWIGRQLIEALS